MEDWDASHISSTRLPNLPKALEGVDFTHPVILLAHQPKAAKEASQLGVTLQLSGHTHGGQLFPFTYLVYLYQPFLSGIYHVGDMVLYINQGTGYWGPPLRTGSQCEVTLITLFTPS